MNILWALIVGLFVGVVAKLLMPGKDPGGVVVTILLGIAGSVVASLIGHALGFYRTSEAGPGVIASIIGAVIVLGIYRIATRRRHLI